MCRCEKSDKNNWYVLTYHGNYSHFQYPKGQFHYSDYSTVVCQKCSSVWRTKAKYVENLKRG